MTYASWITTENKGWRKIWTKKIIFKDFFFGFLKQFFLSLSSPALLSSVHTQYFFIEEFFEAKYHKF